MRAGLGRAGDDDLRAVCLGPDGAFATMSEGSTFVDHTTVSAAVTAELYATAKAKTIKGYIAQPEQSLYWSRGLFSEIPSKVNQASRYLGAYQVVQVRG